MNHRPFAIALLALLAACGSAPPPASSNVSLPIPFDPNDPTGVGVPRFPRSVTASRSDPASDKNCTDFPSSLEAQRFFTAAGGPQSDLHDLDRDGDGYACEWGTEVRRRAEAEAAAARQRAAAASQCFTGPRGGTYTIGPGGSKDYDGC